MKQPLAIGREKMHPWRSELWWKPIFSLQREFSHSLKEIAAHAANPTVMQPALWDAQEDIVTALHRNTHKILGEAFNTRQLLTSWMTGSTAEPFIDIIENGTVYKVVAELPGLEEKDLEVSISENAVIIKGEKKHYHSEEGNVFIRKECRCGSFRRTIALPEEADIDKAEAFFENNILTVAVPKKAQAGAAKTTKLKINAPQKLPPLSSGTKKEKDMRLS